MSDWSKNRKDDLAIAAIEGDPWERQLAWRETPQSYAGFLIYRDLDAGERSLKNASTIYAEKYNRSLKSSYGQFSKWSSYYRWIERTTAYDNMMDAKDVSERKRALVKRTRKHAEQMERAQDILAEPLRVYEKRLQEIAGGIRTNQLTEVDEDGQPVFSDADLLNLGRATVKVIIDAQKAEREALNPTGSVSTGDDPKIREIRGRVLRQVLGDRGARDTLEHVQFEIAEQERASESG